MKFSLVVFAATTLFNVHSVAAAGSGSCACEAEELGFEINCADETAMLDALQYLRSNGCSTQCSSIGCVVNYYIVQSHHDYCPEDDIPEAIEDGFHDYDESCQACDIKRDFIPGAPDCPAAVCVDDSGNNAYSGMLDMGCAIDCSSEACANMFFTLRVEHDLCDHDTLSRAAEAGLHDMEVPCATALCNMVDGTSDQLICDDHGDHGHGSGPYEWAGIFPVDAHDEHVWSMQKVGGKYADPSMRVVFFATDAADESALDSNEEAAEVLIEADSCPPIADGGSITPVPEGSCHDLIVGSGEDSKWSIVTEGVTGLAVFTQHVPIEFERDQHYFFAADGTDVEPVVEEGGMGHGHDHAEEEEEEDDYDPYPHHSNDLEGAQDHDHDHPHPHDHDVYDHGEVVVDDDNNDNNNDHDHPHPHDHDEYDQDEVVDHDNGGNPIVFAILLRNTVCNVILPLRLFPFCSS